MSSPIELDEIWQNWPFGSGWEFRPISHGSNNLTWRVHTPTSGDFILRAYQNYNKVGRVRYELAMLTQLKALTLSFQIPAPIPTLAGESYVLVCGEKGNLLVTLLPQIEGRPPNPANLRQVTAAGQALAELVMALSRVQVEGGPDLVAPPSFGDFEAWLSHNVSPQAAIKQIQVAPEIKKVLLGLLEELEATIPRLYQNLPQQLVHRDYDPSNILMQGHRVSGILDFEFATLDLRAFDLVCALAWWPEGYRESEQGWQIIEAFTRGYNRRQPLEPQEVEALPVLFRLRAFSSLLHRINRYRQGVGSEQAVVNRAKDVVSWEHWLKANQERLLELIRKS